MKRILLLISVFALVFSLTACTAGNGNTASDMVDSAVSGAESVMSEAGSALSNGDTTKSDTADTNATTGALKDGKYTAEGKEYDDEGYRPYVEIEVENGKITDIDCDAVNESGDFKKDNDKYDNWEDKIELFEDEVEVKGLENVTVNDDGLVSGINGMDLNVGEYAKLLKEAIDKAKK